MSENRASVPISENPAHISVPVPPQPSYPTTTFYKTQRRHAQRPINQFPWKSVNLELSGQGYVVGTDWAMTSFDNRTDDQFFDSKRLQTIDECAEVRYFLPYDPLNYGTELPELDIVEEVRRLDLHRKKKFAERVWYGTKKYLSQVLRGFRVPFLGFLPFSNAATHKIHSLLIASKAAPYITGQTL